jgi:outer membrane protein TolC
LKTDSILSEISKKKADTSTGRIVSEPIDPPMSIQDVVLITLKNNPDLKQAQARIDQARAVTDLMKASFWPSLGFYTEYTRGNAPSASLFKKIDQRMFPLDANLNEPGWFDNFESGLNARMNLFNGYKDYLAVRMAQKEKAIAVLDRQAVENMLVTQVIQSFYDVLAAADFVDIASQAVQTLSEQLRIMQVRFEGGSVLKSDVLSLKVRLASAQEQLLSSQNRHDLAVSSLLNLMGLDLLIIQPDAMLLEKSFLDTPDFPETFGDGYAYALAHRPEIIRVQDQLIRSKMAVDAAKCGYLPRLDLMMKYYMDDPNMQYDIDRENWIAALILNWDFFTGFATPASIRKAEAALNEMLAADQKTRLKIRLDVKTAYLNRQEAQARYDLTVNAADSAAESFRIVQNHYLGGSVPVTRFLEAELDLNKARIHETVAYYDRKTASAEIARAIGLWSSQPILSK